MSDMDLRVSQPGPLEDIYLESKLTGELIPSREAIPQFYKTHDALDDWHSEWRETDITTGDVLPLPKFGQTVNVQNM